ncbi:MULTISPECIES: AMP-binding protein [Protofrankia]|uniref:AMP-binding protein n=1 Tax=Protofrankia TaxID=2994361 RepID=UPI0001C53210|nr:MULTISPECIES: AMP-binding protein [Protofrankia]
MFSEGILLGERVARPPEASILDLVERAVTRFPHTLAIIAPQGSVTYAELNAAAEVVAGELRRHGIGRGDLVPPSSWTVAWPSRSRCSAC